MDSMTASEAVDPGSTPGGPTILTSGHIIKWPHNQSMITALAKIAG